MRLDELRRMFMFDEEAGGVEEKTTGEEKTTEDGDKKTTTGEEASGETKSLMGGDDDDGKTDGDKGGESKDAGSTGAPEEYAEFTLADGQDVDSDELAAVVKEVFKPGGFTQEQAQAVVALQHREHERTVKARLATMEGWHAELKADPQVGPEFEANVQKVKTFVRRLAGDDAADMVDFFDQTGYGSHPPLFRMLLRAANLISEDSLPGTGGKDAADDGVDKSELGKLRRAYPTMYNEDGSPKSDLVAK